LNRSASFSKNQNFRHREEKCVHPHERVDLWSAVGNEESPFGGLLLVFDAPVNQVCSSTARHAASKARVVKIFPQVPGGKVLTTRAY
jgi:hypothetical protein